jgi:hypothetical protein
VNEDKETSRGAAAVSEASVSLISIRLSLPVSPSYNQYRRHGYYTRTEGDRQDSKGAPFRMHLL